MENRPLVSVVVTCYNYGLYLRECLDSILAQTYKNYEIVVVDDGSTDNTAEVIAAFTELPNFRYIHQSNAGQARAKNVGINNSNGRFIAFLDADDSWDASKLEKQMYHFGSDLIGVVYSRARYVDEKGQAVNFTLDGKHLVPRSGKITSYLFFDNVIPFSSSIVRRECLERFGNFNESFKMGIDWDLWLRISTEYEFNFVDEPLLVYRIGHSGQMSKNLAERQQCTDRIMAEFLEKFPGIVSGRVVKQALSYTHCNRGYYFRAIDKSKSNEHYWNSIKLNPLDLVAYKGLLKNLLTLFC